MRFLIPSICVLMLLKAVNVFSLEPRAVCPLDEVDPARGSDTLHLDAPLRVTHPDPEEFLIDAVKGMVSLDHIRKMERVLADADADGLYLVPKASDVPPKTAADGLRAWRGRVDEFFANAEFNGPRKERLQGLFLDYVNNPPGDYLPGSIDFLPDLTEHQPNQVRLKHPTLASYFSSASSRSEVKHVLGTLENSLSFETMIDETKKSDETRRNWAMKVRSAYFMKKVIEFAKANASQN